MGYKTFIENTITCTKCNGGFTEDSILDTPHCPHCGDDMNDQPGGWIVLYSWPEKYKRMRGTLHHIPSFWLMPEEGEETGWIEGTLTTTTTNPSISIKDLVEACPQTYTQLELDFEEKEILEACGKCGFEWWGSGEPLGFCPYCESEIDATTKLVKIVKRY